MDEGKKNEIKKEEIKTVLNILSVGNHPHSSSLTILCQIADLHPRLKRKDALVDALSDFYTQPDTFPLILNKLSSLEREIVELIVHCNGYQDHEEINKILRKYSHKSGIKQPLSYYSTFLSCFSGKSAAHLLFLRGKIPDIFIQELKKHIEPLSYSYSVVAGLQKGCVKIEREKRFFDFERIVKICNQNKVMLTTSGLINKSSAIKLVERAGYDELCEYGSSDPKDARNITHLKVSFPLVMLAFISCLLADVGGRAMPGENAVSMLILPPHAMIKEIYESYLETKKLSEIDYIKGVKISRSSVPWSIARRFVCELLNLCPAGRYLHYQEFERYLRLTNKSFIRPYVGYIEEAGNNYSCGWSSFEQPLIRIIMSFLGALGIIDIAWVSEKDEFDNIFQEISAFRITPLGAWILKIEKKIPEYESLYSSDSIGFVVQPNFEIMVPNGSRRILHELYFERFLTRLSTDAEVSTYRLDFESMVRALDMGITISEITDYLTGGSDKPVPENVLQGLAGWERQSGRIRLRKVTILETDDLYLLEEIRRIRGMGECIAGEIGPSVSIVESEGKKIKRLLEKNKRFCKGEI